MTKKTAAKTEAVPTTVAEILAEQAAIDVERTRLKNRALALKRALPDARAREQAAADQAAGEALRGLAGADDDELLAAARRLLADMPVAEEEPEAAQGGSERVAENPAA